MGIKNKSPKNNRVRMVDVTSKAETARVATASGWIRMKTGTLKRIRGGKIEKGDVFSVARVAGVMAAKRTPDLIPLCHPIALTGVDLVFREEASSGGLPGCLLKIEATVRTRDRTGVEMEALSAVSAAALTVYDMCKSLDRNMEIGGIRLDLKAGGRSGIFKRGRKEKGAVP